MAVTKEEVENARAAWIAAYDKYLELKEEFDNESN